MSAASSISPGDHWAELSYPLPTIDPKLARHFREQAAKAAPLEDFQTLIARYKDDPDTTDDEFASSPPRTGLLSPSPSPSFKRSPKQSLHFSPNNTSASQIDNHNRMLSPSSTLTLLTPPKPTLRILQQAIVAKRTTRSRSGPTTTFLALDGKGKAAVTNSVLSTSSRPARIQRRSYTKAHKSH